MSSPAPSSSSALSFSAQTAPKRKLDENAIDKFGATSASQPRIQSRNGIRTAAPSTTSTSNSQSLQRRLSQSAQSVERPPSPKRTRRLDDASTSTAGNAAGTPTLLARLTLNGEDTEMHDDFGESGSSRNPPSRSQAPPIKSDRTGNASTRKMSVRQPIGAKATPRSSQPSLPDAGVVTFPPPVVAEPSRSSNSGLRQPDVVRERAVAPLPVRKTTSIQIKGIASTAISKALNQPPAPQHPSPAERNRASLLNRVGSHDGSKDADADMSSPGDGQDRRGVPGSGTKGIMSRIAKSAG